MGRVAWELTSKERSNPAAFVSDVVEQARGEASAATSWLLIAKSFGCYAMPWALANSAPGAWLTPATTDTVVREALMAAGSEHLAIGGSRDTMWQPSTLHQTGATLIAIPGAEYSLEVAEGWRASIQVQLPILEHLVAHASRQGKA